MLQTNTLSYDFGSANPERSTHASGEMISAGYLQKPPLFLFFLEKTLESAKKSSRRVYYIGVFVRFSSTACRCPGGLTWIKNTPRASC